MASYDQLGQEISYMQSLRIHITDNEFDKRILKCSIFIARKLYYHSCFNEYRDDVKKTWLSVIGRL